VDIQKLKLDFFFMFRQITVFIREVKESDYSPVPCSSLLKASEVLSELLL